MIGILRRRKLGHTEKDHHVKIQGTQTQTEGHVMREVETG